MSGSSHRVTVVIANPAAAAGAVRRRRDALRAQVTAALGPVEYVETIGPGDASARAREALDAGATRVLSLGGDGTHHEVLHGLMSHPDAARACLGVLPVGTGGDFRRTLGVTDVDDALRAIRERPEVTIDVGHAAYTDDAGMSAARWFLNLASCGIGGLVDRMVNASHKRYGAVGTFLTAGLRALARYAPPVVRVRVDGRDLGAHAISMVLAGNGRYAGGGMLLCPDASLTDGLLDVVVIAHAGALRSAMRMPHLYRGTVASVPGVVTARGVEVTVEIVEGEALLDLDGESPGRAPVTWRALPARLRLAGCATDPRGGAAR